MVVVLESKSQPAVRLLLASAILLGAGVVILLLAPAADAYSTFYGPTSLQGDVVANGVGVRATGTGDIALSGVPAGASIVEAHAYWVLQAGSTPPPGGDVITFAGSPTSGTLLGTDGGLCWAPSNAHAYRADVTSHVTGTGTYSVAVLSGSGVVADGVSLVVVYDVGFGSWREIVIVDGYESLTSTSTSISIPRAAGSSPEGSDLIVMGADGQTAGSESMDWNGALLASNSWDGSDPMTVSSPDGPLWDTDPFAVSSNVGTNTLNITSLGDCIGPEAFTLSTPVPAPGSCPPPTIGTPPLCVTPPPTCSLLAVLCPAPPGAGLDASGAYSGGCLGYGPGHFLVSHGVDPLTGLDSDAAQCADTTGPTWIPLPMATTQRSQAAGTLIQNTGSSYDGYWVLGGKGPGCTFGLTGNICDTAERLRPAGAAPAWVTMPPMPLPVAGLGAAVDFKHVYAMGGRACDAPYCDPAPAFDLQIFDFASGTWVMGPPMPVPRADHAVAQTDVPTGCTQIYVIGGNQGAGLDLATVDLFDTCTMAWVPSSIPAMPVAVSNAVAGWCGSTLVVVGGTNGGAASGVIQRFNTPSSPMAWDPPASMPTASYRLAVSGNESPLGASNVQMAAYPGDPNATNTC